MIWSLIQRKYKDSPSPPPPVLSYRTACGPSSDYCCSAVEWNRLYTEHRLVLQCTCYSPTSNRDHRHTPLALQDTALFYFRDVYQLVFSFQK